MQNPTPKRKTVKVTLWVKPLVKAELQRRAESEGVSLSATGAAYLERAMQASVDMQYGALLQPIVEASIAKAMKALINNQSSYLGRLVFDAGQLRWLFINKLYREVLHPNKAMAKEEFYALLDKSSKETMKNINRFIPQVAEIVKGVKAQLAGQGGEENT